MSRLKMHAVFSQINFHFNPHDDLFISLRASIWVWEGISYYLVDSLLFQLQRRMSEDWLSRNVVLSFCRSVMSHILSNEEVGKVILGEKCKSQKIICFRNRLLNLALSVKILL